MRVGGGEQSGQMKTMKQLLKATLCVWAMFLSDNLLTPGRVAGSRTASARQQGRQFERDKPHAPSPGEKMRTGSGMELVYIPPGEFLMGSPESEEGRDDDEFQHRVVIREPFWMGKYEVTQAQWEAVMGNNPSYFRDCPQCPVEQVSWEDCQQFIRKLNARDDGFGYALPTEAQWEYACRAGTTTPFSFGVTITPAQVNYDGNYPYGNAAKGLYRQKTVPVGSLNRPNHWGLHDMHGNVYEWCADWYDEKYYASSPLNNPTGPSTPQVWRVLRGGAWDSLPGYSRSADRFWDTPSACDNYAGVRLVVRPPERHR